MYFICMYVAYANVSVKMSAILTNVLWAAIDMAILQKSKIVSIVICHHYAKIETSTLVLNMSGSEASKSAVKLQLAAMQPDVPLVSRT